MQNVKQDLNQITKDTNDDKMSFDLQNLIRTYVYTSNSTYFTTSYRDILQQIEVSILCIEVFF